MAGYTTDNPSAPNSTYEDQDSWCCCGEESRHQNFRYTYVEATFRAARLMCNTRWSCAVLLNTNIFLSITGSLLLLALHLLFPLILRSLLAAC